MPEEIEWPTKPPTMQPPWPAAESPPTGVLPAPPPIVVLPPPPPAELRRPVATPLTRAGELALELVLVACTFGFGWVGWWIIAWADGQTPAKVVLHLHVVNADDGKLASFGRMALREALGKGVPGTVALVGVYFQLLMLVEIAALYVVVSAAFALTDVRRRTLWDRLAGTVVLEGDPPPLMVTVPPSPPTAPVAASTALG